MVAEKKRAVFIETALELDRLLSREGRLNTQVKNECDPARRLSLMREHITLMRECRRLSVIVQSDPRLLREFSALY